MGIGVIEPLMAFSAIGIGLSIIALAGVVAGTRYLQRSDRNDRNTGALLIALSASAPVVCCCLLPNVGFWLQHGSFPLDRYPEGVVKTGMTTDEVKELLGSPHVVYKTQPLRWLYWTNALGFTYFWVDFGPDGQVTRCGGD